MANGIDFVIGGKDQAKPAMQSVSQSLGKISNQAEATKSSTDKLAKVTGVLAAAYVAVKGAMAALGGLNAVNAAYDKQTASVKQLTSALKARGDAAQSASLQKLAGDLQKLTGVSDEVTIGLMQQASTMGFATDRIDDAAKAAIGLADVTGNTLEGSLGDLKSALEGNFTAFEQLNPQIRYMRSNQEKLAAVMAIAQQGLAAQADNFGTVAGSSGRATGAIGDLMEMIGAIIAPVRVLINNGLLQLAESLQSVLAPAAEYAQGVLQNIGPIIEYVREKVVAAVNVMIGAFTFFEVILTNLGDVWEMAKAYAELSLIGMKESVMHTLTVAIPEYAKWFAANFVNLIKDAFNGAIAIITNAGKIMGDQILAIFEFIASGGQGGVSGLMRLMGENAGRSLLDGFESSLTDLPTIAARTLTEREQDLGDKIAAIGGNLGQQFADKFEERMVGVGGAISEELKVAGDKIDLKTRGVRSEGVGATEGRLLTRGGGVTIPNKLDEVINLLKSIVPKPTPPGGMRVSLDPAQANILAGIQTNTANATQLEAVA